MFQRDEEIFVQLQLLAAGLVFQSLTLFEGVVLLRVGRGDFLAVDAALEDLDGGRVVGRKSLASGISSLGACVTKMGLMSIGSANVSNIANLTCLRRIAEKESG